MSRILSAVMIAIALASPARAGAAAPARAAAYSPRFAPAESLAAHGRFADMQAFLDSALAASRRSGPPPLLLESLIRHGGALAFNGRYAAAEPELREAEALAAARRDTLALVRALHWRAVGLGNAGRERETIPVHERVRVLARRCGNAQYEGRALTGLAYADLLAGRAARARQRYARACVLTRRAGDRTGELVARVGLARAESALGDARTAMRAWQDAADRALESGLGRIAIDALNNLGAAEYERGDPGRAVEHWTRCLQLLGPGATREPGRTITTNLARTMAEQGRFDDAERLLAGADAAASPLESRASTGALRAELRLQMGRPGEAARLCRQILAAESALPLKVVADARLRLAAALMDLGEPAAAIGVLDSLARGPGVTLPADVEIEARFGMGRALLAAGRTADGMRALRESARMAHEQQWTSREISALRHAALGERARGRNVAAIADLREMTRLWEHMRADSRDPRWREARSATGRWIAADLAGALLDPDRHVGAAAAAREAFDGVQPFKARTLEERAQGPDAPLGSPVPVTLARLQRSLLREGELFLETCVAPDTSFVFAITRTSVRAWGLPGHRALSGRIARFRALLERAPEGDAAAAAVLDTAGAELGEALFGPARAELRRARTVLVAADAGLGSLPLAALQVHAWTARPAAAALEVAEVPSAAALVRLRTRALPPVAPRTLLALGPARDAAGAALPGAERELAWLAARYAGADRRPGERAESATDLARAMSAYAIVHVAAHEEADALEPWDSALLVGTARTGRWLSASSVARLRLPARLCVLSACGSLQVTGVTREGMQGVAAAFLCAGVPSVLATRWPVDDARTFEFMRDFYGSLERGRSAAAALAEAQAATRARPATRHPYYWAGFALVGEPGTRVRLVPRSAAATNPVTRAPRVRLTP